MTTHRFEPTHYHTTIGTCEPVLRVRPGDTIVTTTVDAGGHDAHDEPVTPGGNPQTGPFSVEGAEPGDTLVVYLDRIEPNREHGFTRTAIAPNVVDPRFVRELPDSSIVMWRIDRAARVARLESAPSDSGRASPLSPAASTPPPGLENLSLPLAPMLGCFGVAPAGGEAISTATSAGHGGNMDYRGFVAGVTVYFPVFVDGALFHLGDCHALQGDGEIVGTGIEVSADVQFTVDVQKGRKIDWPRGENEDFIFTVGNARPLDQCVQHATTEMLRWLQTEYGLEPAAANLLMGQCVEYDLGNIFDPAYTMVCKMPKQVLQAAGGTE
jgi:acetamidase/formamidase